MTHRFLCIPPTHIEPFLKSNEGIFLCNTSREIRAHFLKVIINKDAWCSEVLYDSNGSFGLDFTKWITRMKWQDSDLANLECTRFPRLQRLELIVDRSNIFPNLRTFDTLKKLEVFQDIYGRSGVNINPEWLPMNLTHLSICTSVIFSKDVDWPKSLTGLHLRHSVVLDKWPPNLTELYMRNTGTCLLLPAPLPPSVKTLRIGHFWRMDSFGFIPNNVTNLIIESGFFRGDKAREAWIGQCDHAIHFSSDLSSGPLIVPPNAQSLHLPHYREALMMDRLPKSLTCLTCDHVPNAAEVVKRIQKSRE